MSLGARPWGGSNTAGDVLGTQGHEATETGLAYAPVSQAHGHNHIVQCFALLHCSADQFCNLVPRGEQWLCYHVQEQNKSTRVCVCVCVCV